MAALSATLLLSLVATIGAESLSIQDNLIEVNDTRFRLQNITMKELTGPKPYPHGPIAAFFHGGDVIPGTFDVGAVTKHYPPRASLLSPHFWTYWVHTVAQGIAVIMALKCPCALLVVVILSVLCWPISLLANAPMWSMVPGTATWWLMCAKSVIVQWAPCGPMLYALIYKPSAKTRHCIAIWVYIVLWLNVAWTLCFLPMRFNPVSVGNGFTAVSLLISLPIHLVALSRKGVTLFEVKGDVLYGFGTSLSWLVCYTAWNALFVLELAVEQVIQDVFFWAMMIFLWYHSDCKSGIENYFAMARPVSLSAYIMTSDWPGFLDYFRNAHGLGFDLTSHAFFLFVVTINFLYSFYVLYWEICLCTNRNGASAYFKQFSEYGLQEDDSEWDDDEDEE